MSREKTKKLIGEVFNDIADGLEGGYFGKKVRIGLTTLGSEHGVEEMEKAASMAFQKYGDFETVLIGPKLSGKFENFDVSTPEEGHKIMEKLLDSGKIDAAVTMHYNFPIGVSTVGRVVTPARGREMMIATTTGTSSTSRVEAMFKNALYGVIAAKAWGIKDPTLGILNVDGARQLERALKELGGNGYNINFAESVREDGGAIMRGNDLLAGTPDIMVTDTLTGNLLIKLFSSFTTGGSFESSGFGYGPGIGEDYERIICIISRASGAPMVCEALRYAAKMARNNLMSVSAKEFKRARESGYDSIAERLADSGGKMNGLEDIQAPPKRVSTYAIAGVDVLELDDAVKELWKKGIYAEGGMGCTGPVILVPEDEGAEASIILKKAGYISFDS